VTSSTFTSRRAASPVAFTGTPSSDFSRACLQPNPAGCCSIRCKDECLQSRDGRAMGVLDGRRIRGEPCLWDGIFSVCEAYDYVVKADAFDASLAKESYEVAGCPELSALAAPLLFCFSLMRPVGYELGLLSAQLARRAGIFGCDEFSVFSTKRFSIGVGPLGPVETETFVPAAVVKSKDGTAGNAELFMHVWDSVRSLAKYQTTDWTIKADPDAVLLADRLRNHLRPHTGQSAFMVNCAKPFMPEGPMMFGALEAISRQGLDTYFAKSGDCIGGLPWKEWGEDLFLNQCFKKIGVARKNDFQIYSDGVCTGVDCRDPDAAAFHPKKDVASWFACLKETKTPHARVTTPAPQWFKDYMSGYAR